MSGWQALMRSVDYPISSASRLPPSHAWAQPVGGSRPGMLAKEQAKGKGHAGRLAALVAVQPGQQLVNVQRPNCDRRS